MGKYFVEIAIDKNGTTNNMKTKCKLLFEVEYDENEIIKESLWASDLGNNQYRIDNIPFYAFSVAIGDIFSAEENDGFLCAKDLILPSGNSTVRILFEDANIIQDIREQLATNYGCLSELSNLPNLIAVDIPFDKDYKIIRNFLQKGEDLEKWQYQESCLSEQHQ
jgi:hypothetical protein